MNSLFGEHRWILTNAGISPICFAGSYLRTLGQMLICLVEENPGLDPDPIIHQTKNLAGSLSSQLINFPWKSKDRIELQPVSQSIRFQGGARPSPDHAPLNFGRAHWYRSRSSFHQTTCFPGKPDTLSDYTLFGAPKRYRTASTDIPSQCATIITIGAKFWQRR